MDLSPVSSNTDLETIVGFAIAFMIALAVTSYLTIRFGGRDEQLGALAMVVAAAVTPFVNYTRYQSTELGVGLVDAGLLVALTAIALYSRKFWPMWAAGLHLAGVCVHIIAWHKELPPAIYAEALAIMSWPVVAALAIGTMVEHMRRS